jgi:hypothetical protein
MPQASCRIRGVSDYDTGLYRTLVDNSARNGHPAAQSNRDKAMGNRKTSLIVQPDTDFRKIVGTLFTSHLLPVPPLDPQREFVAVPDPSILDKTLKGARLFKVEGRSAEPIALEGQFLITRNKPVKADAIASLDGRLVVGIDEDGARYFKRLRCHEKIVVLESLNPDGLTAAEVLSLDGSHSLPKITEALEVIGVLFELPIAKQ